MELGNRHQALILTNPLSSRGMRSMGVFGNSSNSYYHDQSFVFGTDRQQQMDPLAEFLLGNEAQEPVDDEDTIRMEEEPPNNVAYDIYNQEVPTPNNGWASAQSYGEDFSAGLSIHSDGEHYSSANVVDQDVYHNNGMSLLTVPSACDTSVADLERTVSPYNDEVSPKTYQNLVKDVRENFDCYSGTNGQASSPMDAGGFTECLSYGSNRFPSVPSGSSYVSGESQGEQLQLTNTATTPNYAANPIPSPASVSTPSPAPSTPSFPSTGEVEQMVLQDTGEVVITFNSHKAASACRNWYGALMQVVPEVLKPQPVTRKESMTISLPDDAISLVDWCTFNKSGRIRVRVIQELVRIFADLHQNRIAKGLSFLGALTLKESVYLSVDPTGEPQLHIVPNFIAFYHFATVHNESDPSTMRLGRVWDVKEFAKIVNYTVITPAKQKEFMISYAIEAACKFSTGEVGTQGDKMPVFYKRLAGHKLAYIQLTQESVVHEVVCYSHEMMESCLARLTHWKVVRPSAISNPNAKVFGLYSSGRMVLRSEELASEQMMVNMKQLPVQRVKQMTGNPLLLVVKEHVNR